MDLSALLVCPACRVSLTPELTCKTCGAGFERIDGIPILLMEQAQSDYKRRQARAHDDHPTPEFEVRRPEGTPAFYGFLMMQKFTRGIIGLEPLLKGASAIVVCAGSGMDAEFLARHGCHVIAADISLGACKRARERARRHGLPILAVVADAEQLPLQDLAVDFAYVHDGLHHLERPLDGLAEMARVAGKGVSINEPAQAAVTALAVKAGLALEKEDSGNRVARLAPETVVAALRETGFREVAHHRYAMHYRHYPGPVIRTVSRARLLPLARSIFLVANAAAGRLGNKLTVQALRIS
jgi:ubiquinone/menaquinone biosynthesis C-methylase UbiE/uncharacterized protein YbaR (Trm112 family)